MANKFHLHICDVCGDMFDSELEFQCENCRLVEEQALRENAEWARSARYDREDFELGVEDCDN